MFRQKQTKQTIKATLAITAVVFAGLLLTAVAQDMPPAAKKMQDMAPAKGYIQAHKDVQNPMEILGGPITIEVTQSDNPVHVALPDQRELDPNVFGTPEHPRAFGGTPGITGVPVPMRGVQDGEFTKMKTMSPFGDKHVSMQNGTLNITATDATATDAANSDDKIQFEAKWEDADGNTYSVTCNKVLPHGLEFPTFGGVVTNHILHGFSRVGTALMPSEFAYLAFWGMGQVKKNGEVVDDQRIVHGMLTEYVRTEGYELAMDHEVDPTSRHFHLMVAPFKPNKLRGVFESAPVKTGFTLENGKELPFWHVMFAALDINAERQQ